MLRVLDSVKIIIESQDLVAIHLWKGTYEVTKSNINAKGVKISLSPQRENIRVYNTKKGKEKVSRL